MKRLLSMVLVPALLLVLCAGWAIAQTTTSARPAKSKATDTAKLTKAQEPGDDYPRPPKPSKQYTIGVVVPHLSNPHHISQAFGFYDEGEKLGAKVILLEAGGYTHIEKQISQMEDLVASKVDAIDLVATNGAGTVPGVERAAQAGIPVINCNVMTNSDKVVARIRSDDSEAGRMQADYMAKALNGKGNVVMLRGPAGTSWAIDRGDAFRKRIAQIAPNIKILAEQWSDSSPVEGLRIMEDYLQTFSQIDGLFTSSDMVGVGAAQAIMAAGKAGKIVITSTDMQPDTERFIRQGVVSATVAQSAVMIGRWCIRATINTLEKRPVPKQLWTPLVLITKENIDKIDYRGIRPQAGWKPPVR